jgi:hypothetical protein
MALSIEWTDEARADIRALDRATAMRIFTGPHHYAVMGLGDVKLLKQPCLEPADPRHRLL